MRRFSGYGPSIVVLTTAILVLLVGPSIVQRLADKQTKVRMIQASLRLEGDTVLAQINQAYEDIAALVEPSVVHISAQQPSTDRRGATLSTGSGWVYDGDGHIVTNYHVVRDADRIEVQLESGLLKDAELLGSDPTTDIAVLRIEPGHLHPAIRGDLKSPIRQGDLVFAFGSPFDFRFSMSKGIVSGKGRHVDVLGRTGYENFIQVDAAINPGNSGGPLTDFRGRVIGMNTAIATGRRTSLEEGQFAGIGLAIPLEMIEPVVSQIIERGYVEKGLLGVYPDELNISGALEYGFQGTGVLISGVRDDGPAHEAGLEVNDIVTHVNGFEVSTTEQLRSLVSSLRPGDTATLDIYRPDIETKTGQHVSLAVTLARLDPLRDNGVIPSGQRTDQIIAIGIARMNTSTPSRARSLGVEFHEGVLIVRVVAGSGLDAQVKRGSTIVAVEDNPIASIEELLHLLRRYDLRQGVTVGVYGPDSEYSRVLLRIDPLMIRDPDTSTPLLQVQDLVTHFHVQQGFHDVLVRAVDGVSFELFPGETLGLVGESGCGKTTVGRSVLRLVERTSGSIRFDGTDVAQQSRRAMQRVRRDMQMIFQDPAGSLNPRLRVGRSVGEPLLVHGVAEGPALDARVAELLERCGLWSGAADRYPHEFSGGQRQRIAIARALALHPRLIVCDEPTSALDVSIQAQILNLLQDLQDEFRLAYLFISHDMAVINHVCDRIAVMHGGKIVEIGPRDEVIQRPRHEYTRALLEAVPEVTTPAGAA